MHALLVTFRTIHHALLAEKSLVGMGFGIELIPVPRGISSECGYCLRAPAGPGADGVAALLRGGAGLPHEAAWSEIMVEPAEGGRKEKIYERFVQGDRRAGTPVPPAGGHDEEGAGGGSRGDA